MGLFTRVVHELPVHILTNFVITTVLLLKIDRLQMIIILFIYFKTHKYVVV